MFITSVFVITILLALSKARYISFPGPSYIVYADNMGNVSDLNNYGINEYETTTRAAKIEGFSEKLSGDESKEKLSEVTEKSIEWIGLEEYGNKLEKPIDNGLTKTIEWIPLVTERPSETGPPKICSITDTSHSKCEITCSNADMIGITVLMSDLISTELALNQKCTSDIISLRLRNINFLNFPPSEPWLKNLNVGITELFIEESPTCSKINDNSLKSSEFEKMAVLAIQGTGANALALECDECFSIAKNLKFLFFSNFTRLYADDNALLSLKDSLQDLKIVQMGKSFKIEQLLTQSKLENVQILSFYQNNFSEDFGDAVKVFYMARNSLLKIDLSASNIQTISTETFSGCEKLENLDLQNNQLHILPDNLFGDLRNLKILYLQDNLIDVLPISLFDTQLVSEKLRFVNLLNNKFQCNIRILNLKYFLLYTKAEVTVGDCVYSENELKNIKKLWCTIVSCTIKCEDLNEEEFLGITGIFDTSKCTAIELELTNYKLLNNTIPTNWLSTFTHKLHKISIDNCNIEMIKSKAFNSEIFKNVRELIIKNNKADNLHIEPDGLEGLKFLEIFKISDTNEISMENSFLEPVAEVLKELSFVNINNPFDLNGMFETVKVKKLTELRLNGNNFENFAVDTKTFENIAETVESIYLDDSKINKFSVDAFSGFKNLKQISLNGNEKESVNVKFLSCKALISLKLSNMNLIDLHLDTFKGCNLLEILDLSDNLIEKLELGMFHDLENLKNLNLKNNKLTVIPENLFTTQLESGNLQSLNLESNLWHCDDEIKYLKYFIILTKANVQINGCSTPENMAGKIIKDIWCNFTNCIVSCETTDDETLLATLKKIDETKCEEIGMQLKHHRFLENTIWKNWLSALKLTFGQLKISSSSIEKIDNEAFDSDTFHQLKSMVISNNIQSSLLIEANGLLGLNSIESIIIENSVGITFKSMNSIFHPVSESLKDARIVKIDNFFDPYQLFGHDDFENIKILDLSGNNFENLEFQSHTFQGVAKSVEEFYMEDSKINFCSNGVFSGFEKLKLISLKGNTLNRLERIFFGDRKEKSIIGLNLSKMNLESIAADAFKGFTLLENLDLSENSLSLIDSGTFSDFRNLKNLKLRQNKLYMIAKNTFETLKQLACIDLRNNLWECNIDFLYLKQFLMETKANVLIGACNKPQHLMGINIGDLWCKLMGPCNISCDWTEESILSVVLPGLDMSKCESIELKLQHHTFKHKSISARWLFDIGIPISKLTFGDSNIELIANDAFKSEMFKNLKEIKIRNNLRRTFLVESMVFMGLNFIESFTMENSLGITLLATHSMLSQASKSLQIVSINSIKTPFELDRIFGSEKFKNLKILSLTFNDFSDMKFNEKTFAGVHDVLEELYLQSSLIQSIQPKAFSEFKKLKLINLENNKLMTLDSTVFSESTELNNFRLLIANNLLDCQCHLKFLLAFVTPDDDVFCVNPNNLAGKHLTILIEICTKDTETETPVTIIPIIDQTRKSTKTSSKSTFLTSTTSDINFSEISMACKLIKASSSVHEFLSPKGYNTPVKNSDDANVNVEFPALHITSIRSRGRGEVLVSLSRFFPSALIMYYQEHENKEKLLNSVQCLQATSHTFTIHDINEAGVIYNFCLGLETDFYIFRSPFQCQSFMLTGRQAWLFDEHKPIIFISVSLIIMTAFIAGIILTYCLIRNIPTLIKGSKRVVVVNNRRSQDIMILPRNSTQSISSSCRKDSATPIPTEPPTYLTPLPRKSLTNQRPSFPRSSSDSSLKSYVSVSRLPPRFSQVYQRSDFENNILKRNGSYSLNFPPSDIPPPLPRRSIASTASSTQHSHASTAEIGKTTSRACTHNSMYRRRPIGIEHENHYNVII